MFNRVPWDDDERVEWMGDVPKYRSPALFVVHRWRDMSMKSAEDKVSRTKIHTASVTQNHISAQDTVNSIPVHREVEAFHQRARGHRYPMHPVVRENGRDHRD